MAVFGDLIENGWASEDSPRRRGYFVKEGVRRGRMNAGPFFLLTDGRGKFWEVSAGANSRLQVVQMSRIEPIC